MKTILRMSRIKQNKNTFKNISILIHEMYEEKEKQLEKETRQKEHNKAQKQIRGLEKKLRVMQRQLTQSKSLVAEEIDVENQLKKNLESQNQRIEEFESQISACLKNEQKFIKKAA